MNTDLQNYYAQRAADYEQIYQYPERQTELADITLQLQHVLKDKTVLEVACGTGYWTERYAPATKQVLATDMSDAMVAIAQRKQEDKKIRYQIADAFVLSQFAGNSFNACVAGFWWSHIKRSEQSAFLTEIRHVCGSGAVLVMFDNCYVEDKSTSIARTDSEGNTYQIRRLPDDSRHEILKNFPSDSTLRKKLAQHAQNIRIVRGTYYWMLSCVLR